MNYKKLVLVGFISAFVAVLTSVLGVAGTVIGSVISSVLYNMLSEALEKPVANANLKTNFEWDIAYVFPLVVIAIIQLLLIFALLSESGFLPHTFLNVYLSLQVLANNNLYKLLGLALLIISAYPLLLKPKHIKKEHGIILIFVALIFLARGFVDVGNVITNLYDAIFRYFDFPIAVIAFLLLVFVIVRTLMRSGKSESEPKVTNSYRKVNTNQNNYHSKKSEDWLPENYRKKNKRQQAPKRVRRPEEINPQNEIRFKDHVPENNQAAPQNPKRSINKSSEKIQFQSNDLLDDYKK